MLRRRLAAGPLIASLLVGSYAAARAGEPQALLELFTSQGCSSCPAADRLLGEFSRDPSVVAVSLPIDIWDYLGWKDTLANPLHTARQRAYARVRGDRQVYTPQMVVNGSTHVLGSDRAAIERAIVQTHRNAAVMSAAVLVSVGGKLVTVKVEPGRDGHLGGEVWLCPLARSVAVAIGRGENRGRTIVYHNVVRRWVKLGNWTGTAARWSIPIASLKTKGIDAAAVMVQAGTRERPGIILGAAFAPLDQRMLGPETVSRQTTEDDPQALGIK